MNTWAIVFFLLAVLYLVAYFVEIPFFYEGNPNTHFCGSISSLSFLI
jgi:hypothetical protein